MHLVRSSTAELASFDALFAEREAAEAYLRDASGDTGGEFSLIEVERCPRCLGTGTVQVFDDATRRTFHMHPCPVCSHLGAE